MVKINWEKGLRRAYVRIDERIDLWLLKTPKSQKKSVRIWEGKCQSDRFAGILTRSNFCGFLGSEFSTATSDHND
jgi:hypothetical protein